MPASWGYWTPIEISMKTQQETQSYNTKTCEHRSRICKVPEETVVSQNCYSSEIVEVKFTQSCPTLCDPVDYTVHGILQARVLEWVAFPFSRGSSQPRNQTQVSAIAGGFFTTWAIREALQPRLARPKNCLSRARRQRFWGDVLRRRRGTAGSHLYKVGNAESGL